MLENIRNADSMPITQERELMETESMPGIVKFVVVFTIVMTVANVALMKVVAMG